MSAASAKGKVSYTEALEATQGIEGAACGFTVPSEFKSSASVANAAIIKQNNTLIYLLVSLHEKVDSLEERVKKLERLNVSITKEVTDDLVSKLGTLKLGGRPPAVRGKLLVNEDPLLILKREQEKLLK
ncbi:ORF2 [Dioscorea bacilliform virus]|uniref:ORF2 n=1 Tax=Dioscorea bacilliform ES virus TaxID=2560408 RepID=A0A1Z2R8T7_9VIRU|nr:ORF2 [Dioscorea bacilliform virus]ASA40119.1 ORF2 [Dioscorea bacilliform ES virus]